MLCRFAVPAALVLAGLIAADIAEAKSAAWLRRDREINRQLNRREIARVRRRDAQLAAQNQASRADQEIYARRRAAYERQMDDYAQQHRRYRERLADWRQTVAACRAGVRSACD